VNKSNRVEVLLWSIAFPGFGQFINQKYVKGLLFIGLELLINVQSNLNAIIMLSFLGQIKEAIKQANYAWLLFYPCIYMFSMWDAYRDAGGGKMRYSFFPFVFCAFFATVGLIYSPIIKINSLWFGPIWLPIIFCLIGLGVGFLLMYVSRNWGEHPK
jgi:hypothetical protein